MMYIAINQQVTMKANYLRSQLMTSQGQSCNCNAGLRISGAGLPWKGATSAFSFLGLLRRYARVIHGMRQKEERDAANRGNDSRHSTRLRGHEQARPEADPNLL